MKKWIIRISTIILLLAGMYLLIMYQLGDRIFNELIEQQLAQLEELGKQFADQSDKTGESNPNNDLDKTNNPEDTETAQNTKDYANNPNNSSIDPGTTKTQEKAPTVITKEKLETVKDKITAGDKVAIANFVLKKLSKEDINELTAMIARGLTSEEKKRAKEIAYARFSQDEIQTIIDLYINYMNE